MRKLLVVAAFAALLIPAEAGASVLLGVEGSKSRFRDQTNQATDVNLDFIGWGVHKQTYLDNTLDAAKPIPATLVRHREQVRERGDHAGRDRKRQGRPGADRHRPGARPLRQLRVRPALRRDERPLESLLRVQLERVVSRSRALDEELPPGLPPHVPDRARRLGRRHQRQARRLGHAEARPHERPPGERRQGDLEPAGIRQPRPQGQQRRLVLPGRQVRRRRRQRPLRLRARRGMGGEPRPLPRPPRQAVRDRRVGPRPRESTTRTSSRRWPTSSPTTRGSRRSSTTAARAGSTFDLSYKPKSRAPTSATSCRWAN